MGVNGLWQVLQPCARPTNLATLNRKRLAVDASIWIYQFLKAVRDKEGNALRNSHVVGFFRRVCKLLWFGILPVFVFDGGAPALKRSTLQARRQRREGRREDAVRTAGKLLAVQMQRIAEEDAEKRRKRRREAPSESAPSAVEASGEDGMVDGEMLPSMDKVVYAEEMHKPEQERLQARKFTKKDAYHLPELDRPIEGMGRPEDPRIMNIDELEEYARQFHAGEDINLYDFSKIDFDGDFFKSLPPADRYYILNAARIRSRLRMGLSKEQLDVMFPDRMAFSRFQIERVRERNHLTQRLMIEAGMTGIDLTMGVNGRVAGEKDREYILVKNEGVEGGWALGVVSRDKEQGQVHKPIDVDALQFQYDGGKGEDSEDDVEFQDVPIEGLNRLPKLSVSQKDDQTAGGHEADAEDESLFVSSYQPVETLQPETMQEAVGDENLVADEEEDLHKAIAMSLRNQHDADASGGDIDEDEDETFEDVDIPAPEWTQKAAEVVSRPIVATSGRMVAHIVNNRSNAAISASKAQGSKDDDNSDSSDSELDIRAAMVAAAKKKKRTVEQGTSQAGSVQSADPPKSRVKPLFDGPLPFEQLDWKTSIFEKKPNADAASSFAALASASTVQDGKAAAAAAETGSLEADSDDDGLAGGFVIEADEANSATGDVDDDMAGADRETGVKDDAPRPLPPWMADATDIRTAIRQQQAYDDGINAEDREMALAEERTWQRQQEPQIVEIGSSSDSGSDIEIIEAPRLARESETVEQLTRVAETNTAEDQQEPTAVTDSISEAVEMVEPAVTRLSSPEMEFEDVELPDRPTVTKEVVAEAVTGIAPVDDDGLFTGEGEDEFDISDPEEEELFAQMAEEAEEHARFASTLNHKTGRESQAVFEQEVKALRNQQKKDRRDADEVTMVMVSECQALLRLFGIPYITAPMEAEAQCSELVSLGLVDGIVTDDSDTFLFGGTRVYKNMFNGNKFVECFLAADLEKEMSLSREKLISLAQLLGSDYTDGLPGVGPVTAMEILSEFPGPQGLEEFRTWWDDVQMHGRSREADAGSPFRRKFRKSQGTKLFLPTGFPNAAVAAAYKKPEVDSSTEPFQWGVPDLDGLRSFLMSTIGWSQDRTDEVLVPVIRDMNRREAEGTQSNITRFFSGAVGSGARLTAAQQRAQAQAQAQMPDEFAPRHAPRNKSSRGSSRRLAAAVSNLKAGTTSMEAAAAIMRSGPVVRAPSRKKTTAAGRKRKPEASPTVTGSGEPETSANEDDEDSAAELDNDKDEPAGRLSGRQQRATRRGEKRVKA
ncbi:DNA excision repair protein rad2 [Grosmannia clavigera kw1407]|uniref:DNA excision repair protein rad2 n=1 Tax=Grosmannia clavigera (strain kw1407 / UAMH 11150) TaxID=655863 RepID=F0XU78_GROCL|nr:DNA excision repair protein rad2 [Grosmannia clavigera kw1407]EFW98861.1 DNA excision repair protein rad2 [Grosmannia clavigera kw1407]